MSNLALIKFKNGIIEKIKKDAKEKQLDKIIAQLTLKLINKAKNTTEIANILNTIYDKETVDNIITSFTISSKKSLLLNKDLSFVNQKNNITHKLIIGDNIEVLSIISPDYQDKVDVIYIDPPYGCNNSNKSATTNYKNNISRDELLLMLYPCLILARDMLSENGTIFCSIDDKNQAYVKCLFDEIFSEENFVSDIIWQNKYTISNDKRNGMTTQTEHILCYAKNINHLHFNALPLKDDYVKKAYRYNDNDGRGPYRLVQLYKKKNPKSFDITSPTGKIWNMPWNYTPETFKQLELENKVSWGVKGDSCPQKKVYLSDSKGMGSRNLWLGEDVGYQSSGGDMIESIFNDRNVFAYPKPVSLIKEILKIASSPQSIILDFFAGSGTTGQAVLELNKEDNGHRQFILCTNNEITKANPNGIAIDVTTKRLKRIMSGECYDGFTDFKWLKTNEPFYSSLDVFEIK